MYITYIRSIKNACEYDMIAAGGERKVRDTHTHIHRSKKVTCRAKHKKILLFFLCKQGNKGVKDRDLADDDDDNDDVVVIKRQPF